MVLYIHSCPCYLHPKVHRNIMVMQHCFCLFHDGSVLSFRNPILIRIVWSAQLPLNPGLPAELLELFNKFKEYKALVKNQDGGNIKTLWSDNGGEFTQEYFK